MTPTHLNVVLPSVTEARERVTQAHDALQRQIDLFNSISAVEENYSERGRAIWEDTRNKAQNEMTFAMSVWNSCVDELDAIVDIEADAPSPGDA